MDDAFCFDFSLSKVLENKTIYNCKILSHYKLYDMPKQIIKYRVFTAYASRPIQFGDCDVRLCVCAIARNRRLFLNS